MIFIYDDTYEGFLSVIFEVYDRKTRPDEIHKKSHFQAGLFGETLEVNTDVERASRVINGLKKKLSARAINNLYRCWLSEIPQIEMVIFRYVAYALKSDKNIESNYAHPDVLEVKKVVKMIGREVHRMHAFVRFQKTKDEVYVATINPDFDVMPLLPKHFKDRYQDQQWLIYDTKREYGIFYDMEKVSEIVLENAEWQGRNKVKRSVLDEGEDEYENLWKSYFKATTIVERTNIKLHLKHVPHRYWKYLPEKN